MRDILGKRRKRHLTAGHVTGGKHEEVYVMVERGEEYTLASNKEETGTMIIEVIIRTRNIL